MTVFYEAQDAQGAPRWVVTHEQSGEQRLFVWLANTQKWHRNAAVEDEFYDFFSTMIFVPITFDEVVNKIKNWAPITKEGTEWIVNALKNQSDEEILSVEEIALVH